MAEVRVTIVVYTKDGDDPKDVLVQLLDKLPDDPDFMDVAQSIDGMWVDEEGDSLF